MKKKSNGFNKIAKNIKHQSLIIFLSIIIVICLIDKSISLKAMNQNELSRLESLLSSNQEKIGLNTKLLKKIVLRHKNTKASVEKTNSNDKCVEEDNPIDIKFSIERQRSNLDCDLLVEHSICTFNELKVIQTFSKQPNLIGYWNFDEIRVLDYSGNNHHSKNIVIPAVGYAGLGFSAMFSNGSYVKIPNSLKMTSLNSYTISFWMFMIDDFFSSIKGNRLCPLLQKGRDDIVSNNYRRSPAIILDRKTKQLKIYISTTKLNSVEGENFVSNSRIFNQRWIHIALIKNKNKVALLVNGVIDTEFVLQGGPIDDTGDLYLGGVKWLSGFCQFPFLIDEFKYFDDAVDFSMIQAESSGVLAGLQSDLLKFGCRDCGIEEAKRSCTGEYRLCTTIELHTGGYQISRSLGWLDWNTHIWTHSAVKKIVEFGDKKGLALCCKEMTAFD